MKQGKSIFTRLLALTLALVLIASNANLGLALTVFAEDYENSVTAGQLVAENYELSEAEKALLKSGYLVGDTYTYNVPADSALVAVDTDKKTVSAEKFENWTATTAQIVAKGEVQETLTLTDGKAAYTYDGNAFAVKVEYVLTQEVANQETLLNAGFNLKAAVADLNGVYNNDVTGYVASIVPALDILKDLADEDGYTADFGALVKTLYLGEEAAAAVNALAAEVDANGGKLAFQVKNVAYGAEASKVAAAVNGASYKECIEQTYANLLAISKDDTINSPYIQDYLEIHDEAMLTQWMTFLNNLNKAISGLEAAAKAEWNVTGLKAGLTAADYAALDTLVAALGEKTAVTVKNPLTVETAYVQANLSMFDVTVTVKLQNVEDKVDSDKLVENEIVKTTVLTLAKDATAEEIVAAVVASKIESEAKTAWGEAYVAGQYDFTATALPEKLDKDITYTITYAPKTYTLNYCGEEKVVPYGYQVTLEKHSNATQAYDYYVNGNKMSQGAVYTVVGDTTVTRQTGKAYSGYGLYNTIADNYANDALKAILTSGALNGDATLYLRKPDPADAESLLTLKSDKLEAVAKYSADYNGLNWVPYTYGAEGTENKFGGTYVVDVVDNTVNAIYRLDLSNYTKAEVDKILDGAIALKAEAADQIATLDRLLGYYGDMAQLDLTKLGALRGTIEVTTLNADAAKNETLKQEFYSIVSGLINNNLDANEKLKIYNMLTAYSDPNAGGLTYYYGNAAAVIAEINALSDYLGGMLSDADHIAALEILTEKAGFPEYADKIVNLQDAIAEVKADLTAPDDMINLKSENLNKLIKALTADGEAAKNGSGSPYLISAALTAVDDSVAIVQVIVEVEGVDGEKTFKTPELNIEEKVSESVLNDLIAQANAYAEGYLGEHYQATGMSELKNLAGTVLTSKMTTINLSYASAKYDVEIKVDGGEDVVVDVKVDSSNPVIKLPAHATTGWVYEYTIGERVITVDKAVQPEGAQIELTAVELSALKAGTLNLSVNAIHQAQVDLEDKVEAASTIKFNEDKTALVATVDASKDSLMQFAFDLIDLGYSKILLNGEPLLETTKEGETQLSLQVLANAVLNDNSFGSKKLVALNAANGGEVFTAKMDLGTATEMVLTGLDFNFNLSSVPAQMADVAKGLDAVKNYMSFQSNNGEMHVTLNLPEKVYEVYLTALVATGNVDLNDVNAVNNEIAFTFLYDYVEYIAGSAATAKTFQNTLDLLKVEAPINVTDYSAYYDLMKKALTSDGLEISYSDNVVANLTAAGQNSINKLMSLLGINPEDFEIELAMVKEYKAGESLNVTVTASLTDTTEAYNFEAAVIDLSAAKSGAADIVDGGKEGINKELAVSLIKGEGIANGIDFTSDLPARLAEVKGESIVVLLADVDGDLYFNDGAILDLNGKTVNGDITANGGNLIIVDSTMATFEAGNVTGAVNGSVHILAGHYGDTVEAYLKDGYKVTDGYVHNALYWIEGTNDDMTIVLNSDYMYDACVEGYLPSVAAIAADIAADLATKYLVPAAVSVDGYSVYNLNFNKLITLLKSETTVNDAVNMLIDCIDVDQLKGLANAILDDLTDLDGIYNALKTNSEIGDYTYTAAPWKVVVEYVADGDYIDFSIGANHELSESTTIGLRIAGDNIVKLMELICELRDITTLDASVDLKKPTYNDETKTLYMAGSAAVAAEFNLFNSCTYKNTDYITIFTVLFANAGAENADAMVAALNKEDYDAVKDAFDEMTVRDVFEAMKALDRPDDFVELAAQAGVTLDVTAADRLESLYHLFIVAFGKAFEKVEDGSVNNAVDKVVDKVIDATDSDRVHGAIDKVTDKVTDKVGSDKLDNAVDKVNGTLEDKVTTENLNNAYNKVTNRIDAFLQTYAVSNLDKKLGALDTDDDGTYNLNLTATKRADATVRGYTADVNIEKVSLSLTVVIFDNDCLWGDANHDGVVDFTDASLILDYYVGNELAFFCTRRTDVNGDGAIDFTDASLVLDHYVGNITSFPAENK